MGEECPVPLSKQRGKPKAGGIPGWWDKKENSGNKISKKRDQGDHPVVEVGVRTHRKGGKLPTCQRRTLQET